MAFVVNDDEIKKIILNNNSKEIINLYFSHNKVFETKKCSCKQWLEAGFNTSGIYTIYTDGITPAKVYCDQVTDGGGWTAVFKNYGGPSGNGISMFKLWDNTDDIHNKTVIPKNVSGEFGSIKTPIVYNYFKTLKNLEIMKTIKGYNNSDDSPYNNQDTNHPIPSITKLDMGNNVSYNDLITSSNGEKLSNQVEMFINGSTYGKTDIIHKPSATSVGFANKENNDTHDQPDNNLMYGWNARHYIAYTDEDGQNAVRCQFTCWTGDETYKIEVVSFYREKE